MLIVDHLRHCPLQLVNRLTSFLQQCFHPFHLVVVFSRQGFNLDLVAFCLLDCGLVSFYLEGWKVMWVSRGGRGGGSGV